MIRFTTNERRLLADTITPVSIYLRLRDTFADSIMLESSDYHGNENSFSYICCQPIAGFELRKNQLRQWLPGKKEDRRTLEDNQVLPALQEFSAAFKVQESDHKFITNGLFGYMTYDAVRYFEDLTLKNVQDEIPDILYRAYRYIVAIDHFKNEMYLFEHLTSQEEESRLDEIVSLIMRNTDPSFDFRLKGEESCNYSDDEFLHILEKGRGHCLRGDVFQIVLSRRFSSPFHGDEFNVYRALRSVNPSPYLFYFDYSNFKIFGSSPESQIVIRDGKASIWPIAGTFRRTGNDLADAELARTLSLDEKENSEHVMLVDLARNDLSRNSTEVNVDVFKEVQYYSHVIHLVSKVTGRLDDQTASLQLVADTFPAGTLSGAPKHMAMQLIDKYENISRNYYGGAIGFLGFNGEFNHAIMIRSFLSRENKLNYQAGAGIVAKSVPESELNEVNNKLAALRQALEMANGLSEK